MKKHFFQINFEILLSDTTSLAVGTTSGYKLYSLTSTDSLDPIYANGKILNNFEFDDYDFIGRNQINLFFRNLIKLSFYDIL